MVYAQVDDGMMEGIGVHRGGLIGAAQEWQIGPWLQGSRLCVAHIPMADGMGIGLALISL